MSYNREIRPLLSDRCFFCHGPDAEHREADLRLDVEDAAKEYAIVPGDIETSELVSRITADDPELLMPPPDSGKSLSKEERQLLIDWVKQGAPYEAFWAYVPPERSPMPSVSNEKWAELAIDRWILHRLDEEGLSPSPPADKVTLLRRLSFDLTGLPPTLGEVDAFLEDESGDAWEKQIDRLLSSEHFGERMAMYWLDLVRYADTVGYHGDQDHSISPYRDYVIDAFNTNMPFDQFTTEQLAGDLLPHPTTDQQVATGYNRLLQTSHEGGVQPKEYLAIYAADRIRNLSAVWMGATVGCAQCHDHKYDPYTMRDFYSLEAFFADVDEAQHFKLGSNALPTARPPELEVLSRREREQLETLQTQLKHFENRPEGTPGVAEKIEALKQEIEKLNSSKRRTMVTQAIEPRTIRVLPRGNWLDDSGPIVTPAIPEFLGSLDRESRPTRLDLAKWLADPKEGIGQLTARVMANRLWYLMFGMGLAKNLDDFGGQGEPPVHPELLDHLALEFLENGWDVKRTLKQIALSRTYQQSSTASPELRRRDPENRFYARQSSIRLPAEMVRDMALSVSGLLVDKIGGRSVRPWQPDGYYRHLNFPKRTYVADEGEELWRRGLYVHWQRQFLHPMLKAFDAPSREECTAARPVSNTPLAALVLLNDPTFVECARHFALRVLDESEGTDQARLDHAFRLALSRTPDEQEREVLLAYLNNSRRMFAESPEKAEELSRRQTTATTESEHSLTELAAWTQLCRAILNLNEAITRN
ncbi:MAG: PSD1 domain-containing protein [Planctomycetaceae bacterium]|nr:PSD1 domain-containing protein [Planctomycetaceae bacterium]